jgi:integrase
VREVATVAYFTKTKAGWRAQVERRGVRKSRVFATKGAASAWAAQEEAQLLSGRAGALPKHTLTQALRRYELEVSSLKRSARFEALRFTALQRDFPALCGQLLSEISVDDLARWRDARRQTVSDASVLREAGLLRSVWAVAAREWGWCAEPTPWAKLKMPRAAHARTRQSMWVEVKQLLRHMGYVTGQAPARPQQQVAWAYLVAHHTAMRAGEVLGLKRSTVDLVRRVVTLHDHKTMERAGLRLVPVTRKAGRVLQVLDDAARAAGRDEYFTLTSASLDALFRKVRDRLLIDDLHFHDARAAALTRLSRRMDVLRLSRISGHRDLNQLLRAYYRETAADVAAGI